MTGSHRPVPPEWTCDTCGSLVLWPCAPRRDRFAADYVGRRGELIAVLGMFMISALDDLDEDVKVVNRRFVGWVPDRL